MPQDFTHFDASGNAIMVDVTDKQTTERLARAQALVKMAPATLALIDQKALKKGDVLSIAQLAGIMGAKQTPQLIPLCHPLALTSVRVDLRVDPGQQAVVIEAQCKLAGKTGVEMEALTAVSIAALTVYDMCKAVDKDMVISDICLVEKIGGKSGHYQKK